MYEQGIIPGRNTFGEMETGLRDRKIAELELLSSTV